MFNGAGSYLFISEQAKSVIERFDIGKTQIFPVTIYEYDGVTPRPEKYFVLNIAEFKRGFVLTKTEGGAVLIENRWRLNFYQQPAVRPSISEGGDLWLDPLVRHIPFLSDRLAKAMKKEKLSNLRLKLCKVVD